MPLLFRLTSSFDFVAGQSTRCGLVVLKVQGSRSIGAIFGQANQNRGKSRERHFPRTSPILHIRVCFCFYALFLPVGGRLGGRGKQFPLLACFNRGQKVSVETTPVTFPPALEHHRKDPIQIQNPCVSIILRPLFITALPALGSPVTGISHERKIRMSAPAHHAPDFAQKNLDLERRTHACDQTRIDLGTTVMVLAQDC